MTHYIGNQKLILYIRNYLDLLYFNKVKFKLNMKYLVLGGSNPRYWYIIHLFILTLHTAVINGVIHFFKFK